MAKRKLFSKAFFAEVYGFEAEDLTYGILRFEGAAGDTRPVMLIKEDERFINILEQAIQPKQLPNLAMGFEEAKLIETEETFCFESPNAKISFNREDVEACYNGRYNF